MKFIGYTLATALLAFVLQHIGPWWMIAVAGLVIGFIAKDYSAGKTWLVGALGIFLLWTLWGLYSDMQNDGLLSSRIGALFGGMSGSVLAVVTGLIGGIVGGLAGMTGRMLGSALAKK